MCDEQHDTYIYFTAVICFKIDFINDFFAFLDGSETGRRIALETDVTEVGSEWGGLQLAGLRPRHCVIASTEGIVTLTPSSRDADIYVNGQRIYETTILQHGAVIRFGRTHYFRFSHRAGQPFSER